MSNPTQTGVRIPDDLRDTRRVCGGDGAAELHRFDEREAESFEQGRKDEADGSRIERRQIGARHVSQHTHQVAEAFPFDRGPKRTIALHATSGQDERERVTIVPPVLGHRRD